MSYKTDSELKTHVTEGDFWFIHGFKFIFNKFWKVSFIQKISIACLQAEAVIGELRAKILVLVEPRFW